MAAGSARALPSGTVTFLFTDVERSTQTVGEMGDESYAEVQDLHRKLLRDAFAANNGVEVGTEGDAFFVAFAKAGDAVAAAVDGQRALAKGSELRVRMGIHTGEAVVRDENYVGHDVHRAKRICDAGHGGQILLSQTTAGLIGSSFGLADLGPHRLKDLGEPQRLYQLIDDSLPRDFPPLRSLARFRHNLPPQSTSFVGRENEISEIRKLLADNRLVTLTGVGGCGKTRLAIQVGVELLDDYPDGVYFVDLAPVSDPAALVPTIAGAVGVPMGNDLSAAPSESVGDLLLTYLANRKVLLILDNCEHLLDSSAEIAERILRGCGQVTTLATSREALEVEGEHGWRVPSLSVPKDATDVERSEAVSLFSARAAAVRPSFELTPANVDAVIEICRRLDGIALAIEFAASRVSHMSPQEIAARLSDAFRLLTGGRRRVQRQQTLEAALDWSYTLLTEPERTLLRRLAVFSGSFMLAAAEDICGDETLGPDAVLDLLASLVAKSLISIEEVVGTTRYRLIETVRQYASGKLRDAGESDHFRSRHRDWYQAQVERLPWEDVFASRGTGASYVFDAPSAETSAISEQPNLRTALEWSESEGRSDLVVRMACRLRHGWFYGGYFEEGYRWLTRERPEDLDLTPEERVAALSVAQVIALMLSDPAAGDLGERAVMAGGDKPSVPLARALSWRGVSRALPAAFLGDDGLAAAAREDGDAAIAMSRGLSTSFYPEALMYAGFVELILGDLQAAEEKMAQAAAAASREFLISSQIATPAHLLDHHELALVAGREAVESIPPGMGAMVPWIGYVVMAAVAIAGAGEIEEAKQILIEHLDDVRRSGTWGSVEQFVLALGILAQLAGDSVRASKLLAWVGSRSFDLNKYLPSATSPVLYVHYLPRVRESLEAAVARRCREEGRAMSEEEAITCGLEGLATSA